MSEIVEGAPAPDFNLETPDGPVKLADFKGKAVALYFYPKDNTTGCAKEAQEFTERAADFAKAGVTVIGVSKDSLASHKRFIDKYNLGVVLASDPAGEVIDRYGSWVEKTLYGRKYMGIDRSTFLISNGKLARVWRKVRVANHAQEVLTAAQGL